MDSGTLKSGIPSPEDPEAFPASFKKDFGPLGRIME